LAAGAQTPVKVDPEKEAPQQEKLGGTPALDMITLRATGPGTPLRFGNVVMGSERVMLDGQILTASRDYGMDYATGVVYLKRAQKAGQTLTVSYRYAEKPDPEAAKRFTGFQGFKYSLVPGNLNLLMGLGMTERTADGRVMSGNIFGWQNSFKFGQGSLSGLYVYGDRKQNTNQAGLQMDPNFKPGNASADEGKSQLILQNLSTKLMGGDVSFDYQDVSKNFSSFDTVRANGYDEKTVSRLHAERGLTRFGMAFKDVKFGSALALSNSYRKVSDENGSLEWRSYGLQSGGLKVNYNSQTIDKNFARFKDIAEAEREQLMREAGMSRQNLAAEFAAKTNKLSFNQLNIKDDATGKTIRRSEYVLDTSRIKFNLGDQEVDTGFARFDSLMGPEKAAYGREAGLKRQWMGLQASILGKDSTLSFTQSFLSSPDGKFSAQNFGIGGKTWSLQHVSRKVDSKFKNLNAMNEGEMDSHIKSIANMYGPGVATRPEDRAAFQLSAGIDREYSSLSAQPFKGWNVSFAALELKGQKDGAKVDSLAVSNSQFSLTARRQALGKEFSEQASLMEFEKQRLGMVAGLDRTDFGFNMKLGGTKQMSVQQMAAQDPTGGVKRTMASYQDKKIDVQVATREVDPGFKNAGGLMDPEKDLLASLQGFNQRDAKVKWQILPNLSLDAFMFDAKNDETGAERMFRNTVLNWSPDRSSNVNYTRLEQKSNDPLSVLFANITERISFNKDFGKYGKLAILDERHSFDGKDAKQLDVRKQYLAYETKVDKRTQLRTEQSRTKFENGDKEDMRANTVSTQLTKNAGVSVTDVKIDRTDDKRDEKKRNYGFWIDLGNGLRVSYGYARHLNGDTEGTLVSSVTVGSNAQQVSPDKVNTTQAAQVGNMLIGGGYGVNQWDKDSRTQAFTNVNLATAKPLNLGFMRDVKFSVGLDSSSDYAKWMKENRVANFSGRIGSNVFGYEYMSQMHPSGIRGIDRVFKLQTDQSDKRLLRASIFYKIRTMPTDELIMIRDFNITAKPLKNLEVTNQVQTNPEVARGDLFMGSLPQAARSNKWRMDWTKDSNFTLGASWQELVNEQSSARSTTGGVNMKLFGKSGSPLSLFYGVEQLSGNIARRTAHRYHIQFDQKPGQNQMFSLFAGNVSYEHSIADGQLRNNWTLRMNYQLRF
jgi:hypothetical protein